MNIIDKAIGYFSPKAAVERLRARNYLKTYARIGAETGNPNRRSTRQKLDAPDSRENHRERVQTMREVRWLEENMGLVKGILRKVRIFSVGRLSYIARSEDKEWSKKCNAYVEKWMRHADATGRHHFRALVGLGAMRMVADGDCGFAVTESDDIALKKDVCPIRLQAFEADCIGRNSGIADGIASKVFKSLADGEKEVSGVVVDKLGIPRRYRIYSRRSGTETQEPLAEYDAANFILLRDSRRLDGYRGFSAFDCCIDDCKDIKELLGLEKVALKHLASKSGIVTNAVGAVSDVTLDDPVVSATGEKLTAIQPGQVSYLAAGESFVPLEYDRPSQTFNGFIDTLVRSVGHSVNLPFGFVYQWGNQGTAVRMDAAIAAREIEQIQLTLEEQLLDRIVRRVIARGIRLGHLPDVPDWDQGEWRYPAKVTADVGRESKAMIEENMSGLRSKAQIAADNGEDYGITRALVKNEALDLVADAADVAKASGGEISLKDALFLLEKRAPNAPTEPAPQAAPAPKED